MDETQQDIAKEVAAIGRIVAVPTLLAVLCETTGMRFAVVARVTGSMWTACAVRDDIQLGVKPGGQLAFRTNLAFESEASRTAIVVQHASADPRYGTCADPGVYHVESYISVPIFLPGGRYFGKLYALDPRPLELAGPHILAMFNRFAALVAVELERQLQREQEHSALLDARAASELREQFIAILGHDLRNPLQAAYASSEMLQRKLTDPDSSVLASRINTSLRRMSGLIDDVLDFARGRLGGGIGVEFTEVQNINTGLTTVVQELQEAQPGCKILSSIDADGSIRCDLGRLQQVASNLLANALTHGRAHTPVKFKAYSDAGDLIMQVWNAGDPIPPDSLGKIFEPFWRHSASGNSNGLGLGLHICSQIVRAHGGQISVTSTAADGTLFTARFPLATLPILEQSRTETSPEAELQPAIRTIHPPIYARG
jgi:signal transduction histidine kinase